MVKATATFDERGRVRYAINVFREITGQKEAEFQAKRQATQMSHLYAITAALSGTTDVTVIAETLADQTLTAFGAVRGAVVLRSEDEDMLETVAWRGHNATVIEHWRRFALDDTNPIGAAILRNEPVVLVDADDWLARFPDSIGNRSRPPRPRSRSISEAARSADSPSASIGRAGSRPTTSVSCSVRPVRERRHWSAPARTRSGVSRRSGSLLARAGGLLAQSLDYPKTLTAVVDLVVPRFADWATVELLEPNGSIDTLAVAHVIPRRSRWRRSSAGIGRRTCRPRPASGTRSPPASRRWCRDHRGDDRGDRDPEVERLIRELQLSSAMIGRSGARPDLGAMTYVWAESGRTYSSADSPSPRPSRLASRWIDNARLYRDRDHVARTLQHSLLPPDPPTIEGLDLAASYRPAGEGIEAGGDFYDAFDIGEGDWTVALGDVVGKGPDAAALMGMVRHTIRAAAIRERAPARVLATVNAAVARQTTDEQFCTAVAARLRPQGEQVMAWICVAGHPSPVILRADGSLQWIEGSGALLGVLDDAQLTDQEIRLSPGDTLILYTDGVTEERGDGGPFGERGLVAALSDAAGEPASEIVDRIERAVLAHGSGEPRDDIAILAVRATG